MRDYSFGNFISALRVRRGLSQYQLGALVGVSDKAVSKWENGVSKPRTNTIMKLAEVLDIGIDELLACKYVTFNHKRKDLFAMDEEIIRKAECRMMELYGEHPPVLIRNRFKTEKLMLKNQMMLRWIGFLGELHDRFYEEDAFFLVRGAQLGASFIAWLLRATNVNPLAAHYYCPKCKKIEFIPTTKCGMDLPDKICSCGTLYEKDGFGIDSIHMYPMSGGIEIDVSKNAMEIAQECFKEYFCGYSEIRKLEIEDVGMKDDEEVANSQFNIVCYIIIPGEIADRYPEEVIKVSLKDSCTKYLKFDRITIIKDQKSDVSFRKIENMKIADNDIQGYLRYEIEEGKLSNISAKQDFNELASNFSNPCFSDLLAIEGILHGTGVWEENGEVLYTKGIALNELLTNREDVYTYLYQKLNGKCCDNPSGQVYEIIENLRKSLYKRYGMSDDIEQLLLDNDVPEWYVESMKKISYLFPKAHLITFLLKDISNYIYNRK